MFFSIWLLPLRIITLRFIHIAAWSIVHSSLFLSISTLCRYVIIYSFTRWQASESWILSPWAIWIAFWPISCPCNYWQYPKRSASQSKLLCTDRNVKQTSLRWHWKCQKVIRTPEKHVQRQQYSSNTHKSYPGCPSTNEKRIHVIPFFPLVFFLSFFFFFF